MVYQQNREAALFDQLAESDGSLAARPGGQPVVPLGHSVSKSVNGRAMSGRLAHQMSESENGRNKAFASSWPGGLSRFALPSLVNCRRKTSTPRRPTVNVVNIDGTAAATLTQNRLYSLAVVAAALATTALRMGANSF